MIEESISLLKKGAASFHIELTDEQIAHFIQYYEKLIDWNEKINLTAITEERDVVIKHFLDSLSVLPFIPKDARNCIDVGTGAGFPGIPIKIIKKDLSVTLLDSLDKRVRFLNDIISNLGLEKIRTIHGRAEDFARNKEYREVYDFGIARAVASLPVLAEYILPFVRIGGFFIAMKGSDVGNEINISKKAISVLGGRIHSVENFSLPYDSIGRHLVFIKKIRQTPTQYPRKSGKPSKSPIL